MSATLTLASVAVASQDHMREKALSVFTLLFAYVGLMALLTVAHGRQLLEDAVFPLSFFVIVTTLEFAFAAVAAAVAISLHGIDGQRLRSGIWYLTAILLVSETWFRLGSVQSLRDFMDAYWLPALILLNLWLAGAFVAISSGLTRRPADPFRTP